MPDITAIITAHKERVLAGPAIASFDAAIRRARAAGLSVEGLAVLDRADELTTRMFDQVKTCGHTVIANDGGDPGLTRNRGVGEAKGDFVAFLDADDLWSENWLEAAFAFLANTPGDVIAHSEINVVFGEERTLWVHADSTTPDFDLSYQRIGNHWDSMSFGPRRLYAQYPFLKNDVAFGYGHEDWHWNNVTLEAGIQHRPVPGTIHMKRRRPGSQMAKCAENDVVVRPSALAHFDFSSLIHQKRVGSE